MNWRRSKRSGQGGEQRPILQIPPPFDVSVVDESVDSAHTRIAPRRGVLISGDVNYAIFKAHCPGTKIVQSSRS